MRITSDKDLNKMLDGYLKQGWTLEGKSKHLVVRHPDGQAVVIAKTPSDKRAVLNMRALMRRIERGGKPGTL